MSENNLNSEFEMQARVQKAFLEATQEKVKTKMLEFYLQYMKA